MKYNTLWRPANIPFPLFRAKFNFKFGIYFFCQFCGLIIIWGSFRHEYNKPFPLIILDNQFQAWFKDGPELIKILWKMKMKKKEPH